MSAGPVMHMWEGIAHVQPTHLEFDREAGTFHMRGEWRNSYEAEIHLADYGISDTPVCHTLTGYASGWCSAFLGAPLEVLGGRAADHRLGRRPAERTHHLYAGEAGRG